MNARGLPQTTHRLYFRTPNFGFRFALAINDFFAICLLPSLRREGHAEELEQTLRLLVGLRRRHDADLQPAETVHLVVIDLGERDLLAHPERVVAPAVERSRRGPAEVPDPGQREHSEAPEAGPPPATAEGLLAADRVAGPDAELGDRPLGLRDHRLLAGDQGQVAEGRVDRLRVRQGLAEADVQDDLRELRHLVRVAVLELLPE